MKTLSIILCFLSTLSQAQGPTSAPWTSEGGTNFKVSETTPVQISITARTAAGDTPIEEAGIVLYLTDTDSVRLMATPITTAGNLTAGIWIKQSNQIITSNNDGVSDTREWGVWGLIEGIYYFTYKVKVIETNIIYHKTVKVIVRTNNTRPYVSAGNDTTVWTHQHDFLNQESFRLDASNSVDAETYLWEQTEGPQVTIENASSALATVQSPPLGIYKFKLTINASTLPLTQIRVFKHENRNTKNSAKTFRAGGGMDITIPPSSTGIDARGVRWAKWDYSKLSNSIKSMQGIDILGDDRLLFDFTNIDSCPLIKLNGFGGLEGHPVWLRPKTVKPVVIRGNDAFFLLGAKASHKKADTMSVSYVIVDGGHFKSSGVAYGWQYENDELAAADSTLAGVSDMQNSYLSDCEFRNVYLSGYNMFQVKKMAQSSGSALYNRFWTKNIKFKNCFLKNVKGEALYVGETDQDGDKSYNWYNLPPRMDSVEFVNCVVDRTGWDGLQLANCRTGALIRNCLLMNNAYRSAANQESSLQFGGNNNGVVEGNIILNNRSANAGNGIEAFGYGTNTYRNNIVIGTPTGTSLYMKHIDYFPYATPRHTAEIYGNVFGGFKYEAIRQIAGGGIMGSGKIFANTFIHPTDTVSRHFINVQSASNNIIYGNKTKKTFPFVVNSVTVGDTSFVINATLNGITSDYYKVSDLSLAGLALADTVKNKIPVILFPQPVSLTLPEDSTILSPVVTDADNSKLSYLWTKESVLTATLAGPTNVKDLKLRDMAEGEHIFKLTVSDGIDTISQNFLVQVNSPVVIPNNVPIADAGESKNIITNTVTLIGKGSDPEGGLMRYEWSAVSGPAGALINDATEATTVVTNLTTGIYVFALTVTDDRDGTGTDTVRVVVNLPYFIKVNIFGGLNAYSNAEWNNWNVSTSLNSGTLKYSNGSVSEISSSLSKSRGVTDNGSLYGGAMCPAEVLRYTSNHTTARTLTIYGLSTTKTYSLELYASSNTYSSNSTVFTINGVTQSIPTFQNLSAKASFSNLAASSTGQIIVNIKSSSTYNFINGFTLKEEPRAQPANTSPVVSAGADQTLTLPATTLTLSGTASDPDGTIAKYTWTKLSGPTLYTFSSPSSPSTIVSGLVEGTYTFRLTVTDNGGATSEDDVLVIVNKSTASTSRYIKVNLYGGANPYNNAEWNNWNVSASLQSANFKYDDGAVSSIKTTLTKNKISDNGNIYGGGMAPAEVLRYSSSATVARKLTLSGLSPLKMYSIELYASSTSAGNSTTFTINGSVVTILTDSNKANKANFINLMPSATGYLTVDIANVNNYNYLNGFVLTETVNSSIGQSNTHNATAEEGMHATTAEPLTKGETKVTASPNPSWNHFTFSTACAGTKNFDLTIFDEVGRYVWKQALAPNSTTTLDHHLKPGIYYAVIVQGNYRRTIKIIKRAK